MMRLPPLDGEKQLQRVKYNFKVSKYNKSQCRDALGKLSEATTNHPSHHHANHQTLDPVETEPVPQ